MDFLEQHSDQVQGVLHGFDRILIRGSIPNFYYPGGMMHFLSHTNTLLKDFASYVETQSKLLKEHFEKLATQNGVAIEYLKSSSIDKESRARAALSRHPTGEGLIAVLSVVETSCSFSVRGNRETKHLEIRPETRKHLHYYFYYMDREFGWMYVRIQSWFPFSIMIYINGKEWLKRQLQEQGISFKEYRNSVSWSGDLERTQELSDKLINKNWQRFGDAFAGRLNLHLGLIEQAFEQGYRWSLHQCEYATDVLFNNQEYLEELFPRLVQESILFKGGEDIYSFFGRSLRPQSKAETTGSARRFDSGFRVKHYLDKNSIKMYNKGSVLRVETTINNSKAFKVFDPKAGKGQKARAWVPMGKGVSNLYRFAQVARQANLKYLEGLAHVKPPSDLPKRLEKISRPVVVKTRNGNKKKVPGMNLLSKSTGLLLEAINDARFCVRPLSNARLRELLINKGVFKGNIHDSSSLKKLSNKVTRLIAKLRAHKLLSKIGRTFTYKLTKLGRTIIYNLLKFKKIELVQA